MILFYFIAASCNDSTSTILYSTVKHIHNDKPALIEGELRCKELAEHLERIGAPKCVFLSEDASGLVKKVVYDAKTNQLIGLALPIDSGNGLPKMFSFLATSESTIKQLMEMKQSSLLYTIVAQPMKENAPTFILQLFGTDNTFETKDVTKRWDYTIKELKR